MSKPSKTSAADLFSEIMPITENLPYDGTDINIIDEVIARIMKHYGYTTQPVKGDRMDVFDFLMNRLSDDAMDEAIG